MDSVTTASLLTLCWILCTCTLLTLVTTRLMYWWNCLMNGAKRQDICCCNRQCFFCSEMCCQVDQHTCQNLWSKVAFEISRRHPTTKRELIVTHRLVEPRCHKHQGLAHQGHTQLAFIKAANILVKKTSVRCLLFNYKHTIRNACF